MGSGISLQDGLHATDVDQEIFKEMEGKYNLLKNDGSTDAEIAATLKNLLHTRQAEAEAKATGFCKLPMRSSPSWGQLNDFVPNEDFQEGDIVQVRELNSMLFFEGVITNVCDEEETVDVKFKDGDDAESEDECGIPIHCDRLRKVYKWDHLEAGDTVKVKVGYLGIEGKVVEAILEEESVIIDFGVNEEGEHIIEKHPINKCTKVYSTRFPKMSFDAAARSVVRQLKGSAAFSDTISEGKEDEDEKGEECEKKVE